MEKYLLELIYNYSSRGKSVDNEFVETLVGIVVGTKNLQNYLTTIYYTNDGGAARESDKLRVAEYNSIDKFLNINIDSMNKYIELYTNYYAPKFNQIEKLFFGNYLVTQIILHELEHVSQNKKYNSYGSDDESILINLGFSVSYMLDDPTTFFRKLHDEGYTDTEINTLLLNQVQLCRKYYPYSPTERLAQINSYNTMRDILEPIYEDVPNLYTYNSYNFLNNIINGYEIYKNQIKCPTEIFVNGMGYQQEMCKFSFYNSNKDTMTSNLFNKYSKIERLIYGFDVTQEEYNNTKKLVMQCDKF